MRLGRKEFERYIPSRNEEEREEAQKMKDLGGSCICAWLPSKAVLLDVLTGE